MKANVNFEIGRIVFCNIEKYSVDIITESGTMLKDVPFLSAYGKPDDKGQGVYILPEPDSYVMVIHLLPEQGTFFGRETFCFGFFNPPDGDGNFISKREHLLPGSFCLKTAAENKIIGTPDGVLLIHSSELCKIQMFPFSGNVRDSSGLDNLLRMFMENFELYTDGGFWEWKVDKKENKTNFEFQFKNRPLSENEPDIFRGNIGSQGTMGDDTYFFTHEQLTTEEVDEGEIEETIRKTKKEKIDGEIIVERFDEDEEKVFEWWEDYEGNKKRITTTPEGDKLHEIDLKSSGEIEETQFSGGEPIWKMERLADGETRLSMPGDGSKFKMIITAGGMVTVEIEDDINLKTKTGNVNIDVDDGETTVNSNGDVTVNTDGDATINASGNALVDASGNATVQAGGTATVEGSSVKLGAGAAHPVLQGDVVKAAYDGHVHIGNLGLPTSGPLSPLPGLSGKVTTE